MSRSDSSRDWRKGERTLKTNESRFQKCLAAWMLLRKSVYRILTGGDARPDVVPEELSEPCLSPLERITEHLHDLGLGQRVHARYEAAAGDYILEDADGFIHARDYDEAVVLIERIWLYQP